MNYYERLGIEQTATAQDIKRAYFGLVRKFSPEKAPEEFMQIRQAYEILSDIERKSAFDRRLADYDNTPEAVRAIILEAEALAEKSLLKDAVSLLTESEHFRSEEVQTTLCRLHLLDDKPGKAAKIIGTLLENNPNDTKILRLAVRVYTERGWHNKADSIIAALQQADPAEEENTREILLRMTDAPPSALGATVEAIESHGKKAPLLCAAILNQIAWRRQFPQRSPWNDPQFAAKKFAEHTQAITPAKQKPIAEILKNELLEGIFASDLYYIFPHIRQAVINIGAKELFAFDGYKILDDSYAALQAVQAGCPKTVAALPLMYAWLNNGMFGDRMRTDCQNEIILLELDILSSLPRFIPHIKQFSKNPLYRHAAEFFEHVQNLDRSKAQSEIRRRVPTALKLNSRFTLEWLGEDDDTEPQTTRQEPVRVAKTGRNRPCPCGSGRKFKQCCING